MVDGECASCHADYELGVDKLCYLKHCLTHVENSNEYQCTQCVSNLYVLENDRCYLKINFCMTQ